MPSWKKLIVSGSDASLNSLTVTNGITGSLFGTASWATNTVSASFATTASYAMSASQAQNAVSTSFAASASQTRNAVSSSYPVAVDPAYGTLYTPFNVGSIEAGDSIFLGQAAGSGSGQSFLSNFVGYNAGFRAINSQYSNYLGHQAGYVAPGASNSNFIGTSAGYSASNASNSNFIGTGAGFLATSTTNSTFIGGNTGVLARNIVDAVFIGSQVGYQAASASNSVLIGYKVGYNIVGGTSGIRTNNIIIGTNITLADGRQDSINLGGLIFATGSYSTLTGNPFSGSVNGRIGINQPLPLYSLDVSGSGNYTGPLTVSGAVRLPGLTGADQTFVVGYNNSTGQLFYQGTGSFSASTASFVTSSNVFGPYGSNSILSASYALTASYAKNITISGSITDVDYIDFDTTSSYTLATGRLGWDNGEGTLQLGLVGGNVQYSLGEQLWQYCFNAESTTLTKGQVVYVSGSQGNKIAIRLADNTGDPRSAGTLGFVGETILAGESGWVITEGTLRKVNTLGLPAGALLFLGATPGTYTTTVPTAPSHSVRLGYVERVHAVVGSIYVKIDNGYELGELHDVVDTTTTSSYGDLLIKSGSVWINSKQLTGSYGLTGSLTAINGGFTGSLQGTASWARNAISSSYPIIGSESSIYTHNTIFPGNNGNIVLGRSALSSSASLGSTDSVVLGSQAALDVRSTDQSVLIGSEVARESTNEFGNAISDVVAIGPWRTAYQSYKVEGAVFIGKQAGQEIKDSEFTIALGDSAGYQSETSSYSILVGSAAGYGTKNVRGSIMIGEASGQLSNDSPNSILIGNSTGYFLSGSNNIVIGRYITLQQGRRDSINIGGLIFGTGSYSQTSTFSGSANGRIGINQPLPLFSLDVSGSGRYTNGLQVTGSLDAPIITGSLFGTASWANNAVTASYVLNAVSSSFAATASSADNFTVRGTLTAQTIVTQTITSSIDFVTGSTRFGTLLNNTHQFTGSVGITGSLTVNSNVLSVGSTNVGIGTTSPTRALHIARVATTAPAINLQTTDAAASNGFISFTNSSNTINAGIGTNYNISDGNGGLEFLTNGANTRMFISSSGNVGIGTTTPVAKFQVNTILVSALNVSGGDAIVAGANVAPSKTQRGNLHVETINSIQAVGVGPSLTFGLNASQFGFDYIAVGASIKTVITGTSNTDISPALAFSTLDPGGAASVSLTEKMRITSGGSVGIGTTSPNARLDVNGDAIITGSLTVLSSLYSAGGNTATAATTTTILTVATSSYRAGFFDYTVSSGSNARAGTVMSVWNGSSVEFTDNSTLSIGSTSDVVMSVTLSGANALLRSTTTTSAWTVKATYRLI